MQSLVRFAVLATCLVFAGTIATASGQVIDQNVVLLDDAGWLVAADPGNTGRAEEWWKAPRADAMAVRVPGIFQETLSGYHGVAWYWREFDVPVSPYVDGRCLLRFHAVDYLAEVWLNDVPVGAHEGGETPFTLDVTEAVKPGAPNRLAVRVLNPTAEPIDGIVLVETPHRNKVPAGIGVGGSYNGGGITEPVELFWTPAVRIDDVFVRPDWKTGRVRVQATVFNAGAAPVRGRLLWSVAPAYGDALAAAGESEQELALGLTQVDVEFTIARHRLWQLDDPYLYRLTSRVAAEGSAESHESAVRFGFRELRVDKGYFRLNGKRILLKSSHTGNHCPVGGIVHPPNAPDLLRKDLLYMKSCGFNTVRFIAGVAHPYQLDLCDEIGLMVYEENLASWLLADSPKMPERFDASLREMVLRDRNHPSVVIFGLMNEMGNGPLVQHATASLALLRTLDDTRLILLQSGRWDGQYNVGSISNPGVANWEYAWGVESPDLQGTAKGGGIGGYFEGAGDAHVYPGVPHTPEIEAFIRNLGRDTKPVFLSEYGIGSQMNAIRELRLYEQHGADPQSDEFKYFKNTEERLTADWQRYGMEGVYAFPEEMLRDSQRLHCRQRELGFSLIRSNPKICGYNLTGLLDHGFTGEGLWSFWREFKPGIMDTLQDGWAPLRWCLFAAPMHAYAGRATRLEAVLANEDVLMPGTYPVCLRLVGPQGIVWETRKEVVIPQLPEGEDGPLAIPVFEGDVMLPEVAGQYIFAAAMERGGAPSAGRLTIQVSEPPHESAPFTVTTSMLDGHVLDWLHGQRIDTVPLEQAPADRRAAILVGDWNDTNVTPEIRADLLRRVAQGSTAIFFNSNAFRKGEDPTGWLPFANKGRLINFSDWLYHKECVARGHAAFAGLRPPGIMDWDFYGPLITNRFYEGQDTPADVAAAAFAVCHSARPDGYASGVMLGTYAFGEGRIVLNTFNILENVDKHPAADRMLLNLIAYAGRGTDKPPALLPEDFDVQLKALGYP